MTDNNDFPEEVQDDDGLEQPAAITWESDRPSEPYEFKVSDEGLQPTWSDIFASFAPPDQPPVQRIEWFVSPEHQCELLRNPDGSMTCTVPGHPEDSADKVFSKSSSIQINDPRIRIADPRATVYNIPADMEVITTENKLPVVTENTIPIVRERGRPRAAPATFEERVHRCRVHTTRFILNFFDRKGRWPRRSEWAQDRSYTSYSIDVRDEAEASMVEGDDLVVIRVRNGFRNGPSRPGIRRVMILPNAGPHGRNGVRPFLHDKLYFQGEVPAVATGED